MVYDFVMHSMPQSFFLHYMEIFIDQLCIIYYQCILLSTTYYHELWVPTVAYAYVRLIRTTYHDMFMQCYVLLIHDMCLLFYYNSNLM